MPRPALPLRATKRSVAIAVPTFAALIAGGATAPYGRGPCAVVPGFAPLAFLRDLVKKPVSLDVWSHHPYRNQKQNAKPFTGDNVDIQLEVQAVKA